MMCNVKKTKDFLCKNGLNSLGIVILIIFPLVVSLIPGTKYFLQISIDVLMFAVLALSWDMLVRTGQASFAVPGFYGLGAYVAAIFVKTLGFPVFVSIVIAMIASAIVAFILGYLTLRLKGMYFAIATLAFSLILMTITIQIKDITHGSEGISVTPMFGGDKFYIYYLILLTLGVVIFISEYIQKSKFWYSFTAIRTNEQVAKVMGINTVRQKVSMFIISAVIASVMGSYEAFIAGFIEPYSVFNLSIGVMALAMAIFGGIYSTTGPIIGAIILKILDEILSTTIGLGYMIVYGLIIVITILYLPKGVLGLWKK